MATAYPSSLPLPTIDGFGIAVASGAIRSAIPGHQQQRRVFTSMPQTFSLRFVVRTAQLMSWQSWMRANGFKWFRISLPSMYAGQSSACSSPLLIRLISDIAISAILYDRYEIVVTAEAAPSAAAAIPYQTGLWYDAQRVTAPSTNNVIAETGSGVSPASDVIFAGEPYFPAA